MVVRRFAMVALLVASMPFMTGCWVLAGAAVAGAVGAYVYVNGELQRTYTMEYERVWGATRSALTGLEMTIESEKRDALEGSIAAKRGDGTPVAVNIKRNASGTVTVGVRVGTFGDREVSEAIQGHIAKNLGIE